MSPAVRIGPKHPRHIYLQEWRESRGLTGQQLGDRLGVSKGTISRWESGKRVPNTNVLEALAEALSTPVETLFGPPLAPTDVQVITAEVIRALERRKRR